ncbi:MAG: Sec-independent protein translocase protein TatB [Arenicellaceae bacterium]|nr:Sec-independent protein translocase protein TatB [Arenicellaceae bacterium]
MFDIGFWELCVIGAVLLLVIGPERMPEVAKQIGYWATRARRTVNQLRNEMRKELDSLPTEQINKAKQSMAAITKDVAAIGSDISAQMSEKINIKSSPEKLTKEKLPEPISAAKTKSKARPKAKKKADSKATANTKDKNA